ncbi:MAG TPA: hypothetical protein VFV98_15930, partial [Vicinamibacterales bacterium]|nr:hypothetical protein [Vicinamibacterales bacterium]
MNNPIAVIIAEPAIAGSPDWHDRHAISARNENGVADCRQSATPSMPAIQSVHQSIGQSNP